MVDDMTAKELDAMVWKMRDKGMKVETKFGLENYIYSLAKGLETIERNDLVDSLFNLIDEIEDIDTREILRIGTFREEVD